MADFIIPVTEKTMRAKISRHYKAYHSIEDMGLAKDDRDKIEWALRMVQHLFPTSTRSQ